MKTVTYEEFLGFRPCWLKHNGGKERIKAYFDRFDGKMSALDILNLDDVSAEDKLWAVLREEFIPAPILHEFACVCAEYALTLIDNPDPRSIKAVEVKRAWLCGEATDGELDAAWNDARLAARAAAWDAARDIGVARTVATAAYATAYEVANAIAWNAAKTAARKVGKAVAWNAGCAAYWNAVRNVREAQVAYLIMVLEEEK